MEYKDFLKRKANSSSNKGFEPYPLPDYLFDFQKHIVSKAIKRGRYAIFADCGLGKTIMQLVWADQVNRKTGKPVLILAPLAVSGQTIAEGTKFGIEVTTTQDEGNIQITNYDQLKNINTNKYAGVVLDESSIIKNHEGKLRNLIMQSFANYDYKLACTATPSPNDPMELGNHSEFLDVMKRNEMLSMYFVHDGGNTSKWRLKGHAESSFYEWVSTWAIMLSKPSDIGFKQKGFDLPDLNLIERKIKTGNRNNGMLFNDVAVSATDFNKELRLTKVQRVEDTANIVNSSSEKFIIWVKQNAEADLVKKMIPEAIEVRGNDEPTEKESKLLGFARNEFRVLVTKTKIAQFGLNYQNCHNQIFASLDFSFESLYQAVRRSYRFGQDHQVNIYIVTTDTMTNVIHSIRQKQNEFEKMQLHMAKAVNKSANEKLKHMRKHETHETDHYKIELGDCVELAKGIPDESVGMSIFSPPFAELYTYSDELEDMGNSKDYNEFMVAFKFLVKELYRIIWSGRNVAVHCMDLPIQKGKEGYIGLRDFSGIIRAAFEEVGFIYHTRVTIWKNPVTEMQRTKALGLLHKQLKKDASMSRVGIPDYLLVFRKPGDHNHPVNVDIPVDLWQKWASPIWYDIDYGNTLNFRRGRDDKDEKHIAPLQLDTVDRAINLWSNPGDIVYSPFMGIGTEVYQAVKTQRYGIGHELKKSYFDLAKKNIDSAIHEKSQLSITD